MIKQIHRMWLHLFSKVRATYIYYRYLYVTHNKEYTVDSDVSQQVCSL